MKIHTYSLISFLALFAISQSHADVIKMSMGEEKGTFQQYSNAKFILKTDKGRTVEIPKAKVRELILEEPTTADLMRKGKSKRETVELIGYSKLQFQFKLKKKAFSLSAMNVAEVKPRIAIMGGGSTALGDAETAIPVIDTSEFDESAMSEAQKSALASYRSMRKRYDAFVGESSALVAKMDRMTGQARETLLAQLRIRKNQEQPIRLQMSGAHKSLLAAFPGGFPLKPKGPVAAPREHVPDGPRASDVINDSSAKAGGEVLIIDTTSLKQGKLSGEQWKAVQGYDDAVKAYQEATDKQNQLAEKANTTPDADRAALMEEYAKVAKQAKAARQNVLVKQAAFLKAFPALHLTD